MTDPRSVSWQLPGFGDEIDADPRVQAPVGNGKLCGNVRWLARGNVLVGLGSNALIDQARSSLQLLPKS